MTTSDTDLVAAKKEMWSNPSDLDNLVATVNDEEQRARKGKAKIVYDDDSNKKILFMKTPKKFATRRYPQHPHYENLNGASSSSSSSRLRLRWPDQLQGAKKQQSNIVSEPSKKKRLFDLVPTKIRSCPQQQNLNGTPSSSSSSSRLRILWSEPCSSPLLLDHNTSESEKAETKTPPNPNSQSWSTSPKSRAVSQSKSSGGHETAKIAPFSRTARAMPWWLVSVMRDMKGEHPMLIFEKTLFGSDVNPTLSRFSMPLNRLIRNDFLTDVELGIFEEEIDNGVGAILVDPRSVKWGVVLKRWRLKDHSGIESWTFSLTCGWNEVVEANQLKDGDNITLWSFRCRGILCFALVLLPPAVAHGTEFLL
ncbi:putative B3 domain-containing protein [Cardamine amara subsp. amara]|uniref:B3 domain-containing protein n=1 Tax=Cardamine amara subsp. amara TaxID=228776 RepID=A0ABD1ATJ3_CARAN